MNRIREYRRKMGLTQVELSRTLNISQGALSGYETGRYEPDMDTMQRLAAFFHTSLDELFCIEAAEPAEIGDIDFALSGEMYTFPHKVSPYIIVHAIAAFSVR